MRLTSFATRTKVWHIFKDVNDSGTETQGSVVQL